jgi:hypothetical protein
MLRSTDVRIAAALGAFTLLLYGFRLGHVPAFLKYEEVFFALESHAIATTLRDTHGRWLPMYFQVYENAWYQPLLVYWGALFQLILPVTDATLRLPTAVIGAIDVMLTFAIGLRIFGDRRWAALGAVLLAMTPPHFVLGRVAMDYLYPVPFVLGWLLCTLTYLDSRSTRALIAGSCLLGVGTFSYIAAVGLMPVFYLTTLIILAVSGERRWQPYLAASAGFLIIVATGTALALQSPEYVAATMSRYGPGESGGLDPLQRLREMFNYTNLSARAGLYSEFFNAGYLFFSGGSNPVDSTRTVGVYLLPAAVLIAAGIYDAIRSPSIRTALLVFGFFYAVVPAATIMERYTIDRHLAMLPFGALLAALGARRLWMAPLRVRLTPVAGPAAVAGIALAVMYAGYSVVARGTLSRSTMPLAIASIGLLYLARRSDRAARWSVIVAALLVLSVAQFTYFLTDYFTDYRVRSAPLFGSNLAGGVEALMRSSEPGTTIAMSRRIAFADYYVRLYALQHDRPDFPGRVTYIVPESATPALPSPAVFLSSDSAVDRQFAAAAGMTEAGAIQDPDGRPVYYLWRR